MSTKILGNPIATAEQMASYLLSKNPSPSIKMNVLEFCQLYLTEAAKEGVRGDALFAQSCWETAHFKYGGTVTADQNNYAGLGTLNASTKGAYFPNESVGILAQAQHAKGYATRDALSYGCVDPRYSLLVRYGKCGTAPHWEELGGKWAVPGYDTKKYASLYDANEASDSYGYKIVNILNEILKVPKKEETNVATKVIALSAGHGYHTAGKRCIAELDPSMTREWFLNDRIADKVENSLKNYECKVLRLDDTTGAKDISLANRVATANKAKANVYISIHHDAGIYGGSGGGTKVYYYPTSGCKLLATKLYDSIVNKTGLRGNRATPIFASKDLYEIKKTNMACFIIENGFMDSKADVPIILTEEHAEKTARGIVAFLVEQYCLEPKKGFNEVVEAMYYKACDKKYVSIAIALNSIGVDGSFANRTKIAKSNGIKGYVGTATQNTQMLNLLKAGLLKKA